MPVPYRTGQLLGIQDAGVNFSSCESRSLMFERLADPSLKEGRRATFFRNAAAKPVYPEKSNQWLSFLLNDLKLASGDLLYAQLQSRMMANMAGGVMENAGLCLDRLSGLPCIPGSAVRGCARRMALWLAVEESASDRKKAMLVEIGLTFGWGEEDWKTRLDYEGKWEEKRPDFAFAAGEDLWHQDGFIPSLQEALWDRIHGPGGYSADRWKGQLSHYKGGAAFLPAFPINAVDNNAALPLPPAFGPIQTDVLTSHHPDYYSRKTNGAGQRLMPLARDVEDPNPVVFPTAAPGHVFVFAVTGREAPQARGYLARGLCTFGIGAKTNAGYGWFDTSPDPVQEVIRPQVETWRKQEENRRRQRVEDERTAQEQAHREAAEREHLAAASPEERRAAEILKLGDEPFAALAKRFAELDDPERRAFVIALKQSRQKAKRWAKKKPELLKPWQDYAQKLQPPVTLP